MYIVFSSVMTDSRLNKPHVGVYARPTELIGHREIRSLKRYALHNLTLCLLTFHLC